MANEPRNVLDIDASALPSPHTADGCRRCGNASGYLGRYVKINKAEALRWVCDNCEDYKTAGDLPRSILGDMPFDKLPLRVDRSQENPDWPECEVCGMPSIEFHHWAPKSLFPDWPINLGTYLCDAHHKEWHAVTKAHGLKYPHEMQDVS